METECMSRVLWGEAKGHEPAPPPNNPGEKFWVEMPKPGLTCNGMERLLLWLLSSWVWVLNVYLSVWKPKVQTPGRCRC